MVKKVWTPARYMILVVSIMFLGMWTVAVVDNTKNGASPTLVLYNIAVAGIFIYFITTLLTPSCMRVVKRYMKYKDLKEVLEKETFQKTDITPPETYDLYISKHWIYINDVYIPRKLILTMSASEGKKGTRIYIETKNGASILFGKVEPTAVKRYIRALKKKLPEITTDTKTLYENYSNLDTKALRKTFEAKTTKESFREYYA